MFIYWTSSSKNTKKKTHYFFCRRYQNCSSAATILSKTVSKIKKSFFFHFLFLRPSVEDEATNLDLVKPPKWSPVRPPNSHRSDPQTEKKMSNFWRAVRPLSNPILIKIVTADLQIRIKVWPIFRCRNVQFFDARQTSKPTPPTLTASSSPQT